MGLYIFFVVLATLVCILLILAVLIQNPREGGLTAGFGAGFSQQFFGVQQAADFLEKATWYLSGGLALLTIIMNFWLYRTQLGREEVPVPENVPVQSVPAPVSSSSAVSPGEGGRASAGNVQSVQLPAPGQAREQANR